MSSHSCSDIETSIRSRVMPALLTSASSPPNHSIVTSISRLESSQSATSATQGIAVPPAATIASATFFAFSPTSLTTTRAPAAASDWACARPRPCPAPVTITTRSSTIPLIQPPQHRRRLGDDALDQLLAAGDVVDQPDDLATGRDADVLAPFVQPGAVEHRRVRGHHHLAPGQLARALHRQALAGHVAPGGAGEAAEGERVAARLDQAAEPARVLRSRTGPLSSTRCGTPSI